jgi:hypothetical protein
MAGKENKVTSITLDIIFITAPVDLGATIHAATPIGYGYNTLCGCHYNHDAPEYRFQEGGKTLADVCEDCLGRLSGLGMPIAGHAVNELGMIVSEPDLLRAAQHLFEATRHIRGYGKNCPVCGGTQADADEGCRMCLPLFQIIQDADTINGMANAILLIEDPFEGVT